MYLSFSFKKWLQNALQEKWHQKNGFQMPYLFIKETSDYTLVRGDTLIHTALGISWFPQMCVRMDKDDPKPMVIVNDTWLREIPDWVTDVMIGHELGHLTEEAKQFEGMELEKFCDQFADIYSNGKMLDAVLEIHTRFPGLIPIERIETLRVTSDHKPTLSYGLAQLLGL